MKAVPKGGTAFEAFKVRLRRRIFCAVVPLTEDDIITMRDKFGARSLCRPLVTSPTFAVINIVCRGGQGVQLQPFLVPKSLESAGRICPLTSRFWLLTTRWSTTFLLSALFLMPARWMRNELLEGWRRCEMKRLLRCFSRWERGFLSVMMGLWYTAESKDR